MRGRVYTPVCMRCEAVATGHWEAPVAQAVAQGAPSIEARTWR
jgi:hypothetical protein